MASYKRTMSTQKMVLGAIMTSIVIVFQLLATYTTFFGPFSTALALIPIVIGASMCGVGIGAWLGFVFGMVVILTGGANLFFALSVPGTIITVMAKGIACGAAAGRVYGLLKKASPFIAVLGAAIVCPIVNTGVFLLGCLAFFLPYAESLSNNLSLNVSGIAVFTALASANFLFELGTNIIVSPILVKILSLKKR